MANHHTPHHRGTGNFDRAYRPEVDSPYVQPVFTGAQAVLEIRRAKIAGGMSEEAFTATQERLRHATTDAERVDVVNTEHLLSPLSPDPLRYHREACDCRACGEAVMHATVQKIEV